MKKWLLVIPLIPALVFAAGLRIDLKVAAEKLKKTPDYNAKSMLKMGIDPDQIGFKGKPWWTFKDEDNLFRRLNLHKWDPVGKMSQDSWDTSQQMKKNLGPSPGEVMQAQAQAMAAQARLTQQRMEQEAAAQ